MKEKIERLSLLKTFGRRIAREVSSFFSFFFEKIENSMKNRLICLLLLFSRNNSGCTR